MRFFTLLITIFIIYSAKAQMTMTGLIAPKTHLTQSGSPYLLKDAALRKGDELIIESGVEVEFQNLQLEGTLTANGTAEKPVILRGGINPKDEAILSFNYVQFSRGSVGKYAKELTAQNSTFQSVPLYSKDLHFKRCTFKGCEMSTIAWTAKLSVENCQLTASKIETGGKFELLKSTFDNTSFEIYSSEDGSLIVGNIFKNAPVGLNLRYARNYDISYNTFENNKIHIELNVNPNSGGHASPEQLSARNNNFLKASQNTLVVSAKNHSFGVGEKATFDFSENYWGGRSNEEIENSIIDYKDDFKFIGKVLFDNPLSTPSVNSTNNGLKLPTDNDAIDKNIEDNKVVSSTGIPNFKAIFMQLPFVLKLIPFCWVILLLYKDLKHYVPFEIPRIVSQLFIQLTIIGTLWVLIYPIFFMNVFKLNTSNEAVFLPIFFSILGIVGFGGFYLFKRMR